MRFIKDNLFSIALFGAVALAFAFPELGSEGGPLKAGLLVKAGIMVIFFLQGLSLKTKELVAGVTDFRLHGYIQGWIFLGSPLVLLPGYLLLRILGWPDLAAGILYLALLPTTISSAVAMTSAAGGNVAASIVSTALSNVLGVFWVPTLCVLLLASGGGSSMELIPPMLMNLARLILLPMAVGMLLRPLAQRHRLFAVVQPRFKTINNAIILFIVFAAFCQSVLGNAWAGLSPLAVVMVIIVVILSLLALHWLVWKSSGLWMRDHRNRVAALFCGSQKTLAAGVPMAMAIFADPVMGSSLPLGMLLLPLMCYHPAQLLLAALLIPRLDYSSSATTSM